MSYARNAAVADRSVDTLVGTKAATAGTFGVADG
jgi:hypothetical protein